MTVLGYDRYCSEIVAQTDLLKSCIESADLTVPVISCPGWNLGQLLRHVGGAQRWAETTVRTRAIGWSVQDRQILCSRCSFRAGDGIGDCRPSDRTGPRMLAL